MQWIAPSEKDVATGALEKRLWDAADQFRANSGLKSQEYSAPVLGLIFLCLPGVLPKTSNQFTSTLLKELETLNAAARGLESTIAKNVAEVLEA